MGELRIRDIFYLIALVFILDGILNFFGIDIGRKFVDTSHYTKIDHFQKFYYGFFLIICVLVFDIMKDYNDRVNEEEKEKNKEDGSL